jgi:hypothetical protein
VPTRVVVRYANAHVELEVANAAGSTGDGTGSGHGLVGMRERARQGDPEVWAENPAYRPSRPGGTVAVTRLDEGFDSRLGRTAALGAGHASPAS